MGGVQGWRDFLQRWTDFVSGWRGGVQGWTVACLFVPLLGGFPLFWVELAGISPRRATSFLASPRKEAKKATRLPGHSLRE